jgi:glutamate decarboxylase
MGLTRISRHSKHAHTLPPPAHHPVAEATEVPCHHLPDDGLGSSAAYDFITAELTLDGAARLNLATFVTTWMPSIAARLMAETADRNMVDKDEYPQTAEIEARCVRILAKL